MKISCRVWIWKNKSTAHQEINNAGDQAELVFVRKKYLDNDGILGDFFKSLGQLPKERRGQAGMAANDAKKV